MSQTQSITSVVTAFLESDILPANTILQPDDDLLTSGLVDSIGMMRLITYLETTLAVKIPAQELVPKNFRTISIIADFLQSLRENSNS